jgi:hypothetical protein
MVSEEVRTENSAQIDTVTLSVSITREQHEQLANLAMVMQLPNPAEVARIAISAYLLGVES